MNGNIVTLAELLATQAFLKDKIKELTTKRNSLPRNDKQGAHDLLVEINKLQAEERTMRPTVARIRGEEEKRENHSMWCACIGELYGPEDLSMCFEWMKQEKKRRREQENRHEP